ncbi:MAG: PKD domain-containing protein, partial [Pedobacter sp.]
MKIKNYLVAVIMVATLLFGCKKDAETAPDGKMGITENFLTGKVNAKTELYAVSNDGRGFQHEWKLDGKVVSTAYNFAFIPTTSGTYIIEYKGYNG